MKNWANLIKIHSLVQSGFVQYSPLRKAVPVKWAIYINKKSGLIARFFSDIFY
jgi:p-aminobenzoyl-glutamate transporter AbgT